MLERFLLEWLGAWPPAGALEIVASPLRDGPGWDGKIRPVIGVATPEGWLLSVSPGRFDEIRAAASTAHDDPLAALELLGLAPGTAVFRWTEDPVALEPLGEWCPADDPSVPEWLRPFGGEVLATFDDDGRYLAGVGFKRHLPSGIELSVGTEPEARGRGFARRLVATAARHVVDLGAVPLYLHDPENHASASVAEAVGLDDRGWRFLDVEESSSSVSA